MEMVRVSSSNVVSVGHENSVMTVNFKNGTSYEYTNVSEDLYQDMLKAPSIGSYLNKFVKSRVNPDDEKAIQCHRVIFEKSEIDEIVNSIIELIDKKVKSLCEKDHHEVLDKVVGKFECTWGIGVKETCCGGTKDE